MTTNGLAFFRETELYTSGSDGYHTFRIPALANTSKGTLLAFCEGRRDGRDDFYANYLVLKRSLDNGVTWENIKVLTGDTENTNNNPTVVIDYQTDTIWLAYCVGAFYVNIMSSNDDGITWSEPYDITKDVKLPDWSGYDLAPGHGIQMSNGTLVIPGDHTEGLRRDWIYVHSHVILSDDHGVSWKLGGSVGGSTNECQVVETGDNSLYMTMRTSQRQDKRRYYSRSKDGGITWSDAEGINGLPDPNCQASIVRYTDPSNHDRSRILLTHLNTENSRDHITVSLSYDEGETWPVSKTLYVGPAAYSDLAIGSDMMLNCIYERGNCHPYESIRLAQFNLEWLTDGSDSLSY